MGARPRAFIYHTNVLAGGSWLLFHFYPHLFINHLFSGSTMRCFKTRSQCYNCHSSRVLHYFNISNKNTNITNWRVDDLDREGPFHRLPHLHIIAGVKIFRIFTHPKLCKAKHSISLLSVVLLS